VEEIAGRGEYEQSSHIPFTQQGKGVLKLSMEEAVGLGHRYIGTEHLLLGLLRQDDTVASRVLTELGADHDRARQEVTRLIDEHQRQQGQTSG